MKYALVCDDLGVVVGRWSGGGPGVPASRPGRNVLACTQAQHAQAAINRYEQGEHRWSFDGSVLTEIPDARPIVRFTPDLVELDVGDPAGQVLMEVVDENGDVRTNINLTRRVPLAGRRLRLTFVNGATTINVPTGQARDVTITSNRLFRVVAPLEIHVDDIEL